MSLPADFKTEISDLLGSAEADSLCQALTSTTPPVSLRLNPLKPGAEFEGAQPVPWCDGGLYLDERPQFTADPLLHAGCYYVQEASSMFIAQAFRTIASIAEQEGIEKGLALGKVLDLCAAPGGKSTLWRSLLPEGSLLVANEPVRPRAMVLAENMAKWGQADVVVTNGMPADFGRLAGFFDVVAADVPCSGEGMFRKDEAARGEWSAAGVQVCAKRQREIAGAVWPALRTGGFFVYSTCTFNRQEDEDNVAYICETLGAEAIAVPHDAAWGILGDATGRGLPVSRFLPGRTKGEGFFMALLRKTAPTETGGKKSRHGGKNSRNAPVPGAKDCAKWLAHSSEFAIVARPDGGVAAIRHSVEADVQAVAAATRIVTAGLPLAEAKGRKLVPRHELALSTELSAEAFPRVELNLPEALSYLRSEATTLPPETPRGYVIATFKGHPLGFFNNLGTRANNMYPKEWRIRTEMK